MAKKRFPDESLDFAEKTYAHLILPGFSRYREFWEEFIGGEYSHEAGTLVPYPIIYDAHVPRSPRELVDAHRERIRIAHYTIFIRLIRAHQLLDRLALPPQTDVELFEYLDALESFYVYLGNAWMSYRDVLGTSCLELASPGGKFDEHIKRNPRYASLRSRFVDGPLQLRNNLVHFGRHAVVVVARAILLPMPITKNPFWPSAIGRQQYARVDLLGKTHLAETEELFNELHEECAVLLRRGLQMNGARIDYG